MNICVFGAASGTIAPIYLNEATALGKEMGKRHHTLVFGGGATGVMGALANAITAENGNLIGVAPHFFNKEGVLFQQCTDFIFTNTMRERKQKMEDLSDAFVAAPGGIGTFEEFFEILTLKQLGQHNKPIVLFNVNHYYDSIIELLDKAVNEQFLAKEKRGLVKAFDNVQDVLHYIETEKSGA